MQMTFDLSDDVVKQLKSLPNADSFVNRILSKALQNYLVDTDIIKSTKL